MAMVVKAIDDIACDNMGLPHFIETEVPTPSFDEQRRAAWWYRRCTCSIRFPFKSWHPLKKEKVAIHNKIVDLHCAHRLEPIFRECGFHDVFIVEEYQILLVVSQSQDSTSSSAIGSNAPPSPRDYHPLSATAAELMTTEQRVDTHVDVAAVAAAVVAPQLHLEPAWKTEEMARWEGRVLPGGVVSAKERQENRAVYWRQKDSGALVDGECIIVDKGCIVGRGDTFSKARDSAYPRADSLLSPNAYEVRVGAEQATDESKYVGTDQSLC